MRIDEWLREKKYPVSVTFWPSILGLRIRMKDEKTNLIRDALINYDLLEKTHLDEIEWTLNTMYDKLMESLGREEASK